MSDSLDSEHTVAVLAILAPPIFPGDSEWRALSDRLSQRLHHHVELIHLQDSEADTVAWERLMEDLIAGGATRIVILQVSPVPSQPLYEAAAWLRLKSKHAKIFLADPFTLLEWAEALAASVEIQSPCTSKACLLLLTELNAPDCCQGAELATLAHHCVQNLVYVQVEFAFLDHGKPSVFEVYQAIAAAAFDNVFVVPWRIKQSSPMVNATQWLRDALANQNASACDWMAAICSAPRFATLAIIDQPSIIHLLFEKYLSALSNRSLDRYFTTPGEYGGSLIEATVSQTALRGLDRKLDSILPPEYRGKTEEVSPVSMGSVKLQWDEFGTVPWDEIWTSFCDLAMAGGPPHRGKLLEAVDRSKVLENLNAYQLVVKEIRRGIEMVTKLATIDCDALGWVGVKCDDEAMAVWLMRAIIVENVMVRREQNILFLPAGPDFSVKKEIKNVITAVAKTTHYWRAHLNRN